MTAYKDMNTRQLKRAYLRLIKREWGLAAEVKRWQLNSDENKLAALRRGLEECAKELRHRGWSA